MDVGGMSGEQDIHICKPGPAETECSMPGFLEDLSANIVDAADVEEERRQHSD